jgi:hypothetical protein
MLQVAKFIRCVILARRVGADFIPEQSLKSTLDGQYAVGGILCRQPGGSAKVA